MARDNCECLAAWLDSEPCICDEPTGAPMEISARKLAQANQLVSEIQNMDRALARLKAGESYATQIQHGTTHDYGSFVHLKLPAEIAAGLIRTMRFHALVKLAETGVVSTWSGHRPVVSA